jgi:hypothetical protein
MSEYYEEKLRRLPEAFHKRTSYFSDPSLAPSVSQHSLTLAR